MKMAKYFFESIQILILAVDLLASTFFETDDIIMNIALKGFYMVAEETILSQNFINLTI